MVPTGDPLGASIYTALRPGHDKSLRKDTPGFVSALREKVVSNFHSHVDALSSFRPLELHPREWAPSIPFIDRVSQIPDDLAHHAANAYPVVKRYCVSGYNSLVHAITGAKSAMMLALIDWNMYMDQIAASEGWGGSLALPEHTLSDVGSMPETGLLPGRQTALALREEESLYAYAGSTAQKTTLLLGRIAVREVRKWEVVKTMGWVARISMRVRDGMVIVAVVLMALLAVVVLLGLAWVLMRWWRAAVWLWQQI